MKVYTQLLLIAFSFLSCDADEGLVSRICTTSPYPSLVELLTKDAVYTDHTCTTFQPNFSFLNEVYLFTFSYEIDVHVVLGYGVIPKNWNQWLTVIHS